MAAAQHSKQDAARSITAKDWRKVETKEAATYEGTPETTEHGAGRKQKSGKMLDEH